mmetsp:Transcript_134093/g.388141  ORF Transcript_134093/g.388141 Transcript_134093/m.388141 type:complete len:206 (-) Transcript_134093:1064-1681(-)
MGGVVVGSLASVGRQELQAPVRPLQQQVFPDGPERVAQHLLEDRQRYRRPVSCRAHTGAHRRFGGVQVPACRVALEHLRPQAQRMGESEPLGSRPWEGVGRRQGAALPEPSLDDSGPEVVRPLQEHEAALELRRDAREHLQTYVRGYAGPGGTSGRGGVSGEYQRLRHRRRRERILWQAVLLATEVAGGVGDRRESILPLLRLLH